MGPSTTSRKTRCTFTCFERNMFLIRNVMPNQDGRENLCARDFRQCMAAPTRPIVQSFTTPQGQAQFQEEFKEVYLTMLRSAGQALQQELQLVCEVYDCASRFTRNCSTRGT